MFDYKNRSYKRSASILIIYGWLALATKFGKDCKSRMITFKIQPKKAFPINFGEMGTDFIFI